MISLCEKFEITVINLQLLSHYMNKTNEKSKTKILLLKFHLVVRLIS